MRSRGTWSRQRPRADQPPTRREKPHYRSRVRGPLPPLHQLPQQPSPRRARRVPPRGAHLQRRAGDPRGLPGEDRRGRRHDPRPLLRCSPDRRRRRPDRVSAVLQLHAAERVARPAAQRQINLVRGARLLQVPRRQDLRSVVPARRAIHREAAGLSADAAAWVRRGHVRPTVGDQEKSWSIAEEVREAPIAIRLGRGGA